VLTASADVVTDRSLAEAIMIFAKDIGLRVILRYMGGTQRDAITASGQFDWMLARNSTTELVTVVQGSDALAPMAPYSHAFHRAGPDGRLDLMPYEATMIEQVKAFSNTTNQSQRLSIMAQYQRTSTENVNAVGLVQFPGALMIDKRFANVAPGVPVLMFNWAEDALMRELLFVPEGRRSRFELRPQTLPPCVYCTSNRGVRS
jgi:peptide/nickel transport system substrate-binding protein